jgi:arylsulfatase
MRRALLAILVLAAGLGACTRREAPVPEGPNVLLVTVDTLRADRLGSYGFTLDTSPRIDALAASGVLFERAVAGSSATAPSHASILASRFTREHSIGFGNGDTRLEDVPTLAGHFREAGYTTGAFVGNVVLRGGSGFERGFDVYDDDLPTAEKNRPHIFERIAEQTTERALAWLDESGGRPFFLWVHYQDPHGPYSPPSAFKGRFRVTPRPGEVPLPVLDDNSGERGIPAYQVLDGLTLPSVYESRYADEIFYADQSIGELVDAVDRHSGPRGAVVLLTADHGESFGEGGQYYIHKATTPDVAHVPMILRAPGLAPGRSDGLVHHVDVLPTLLELAGLPAPETASGIALGPLLRAGEPLPERIVYTDIGDELSAYGRGGFLRVRGVESAWQHGSEGGSPTLAPAWIHYVWRTDGTWRVGDYDAIPLHAVSDYFRAAVPMRMGPAPSAEDIERLRALGYVED